MEDFGQQRIYHPSDLRIAGKKLCKQQRGKIHAHQLIGPVTSLRNTSMVSVSAPGKQHGQDKAEIVVKTLFTENTSRLHVLCLQFDIRHRNAQFHVVGTCYFFRNAFSKTRRLHRLRRLGGLISQRHSSKTGSKTSPSDLPCIRRRRFPIIANFSRRARSRALSRRSAPRREGRTPSAARAAEAPRKSEDTGSM